MKSPIRSLLKGKVGDFEDEPTKLKKVLLLIIGAFVAAILFMQASSPLRAIADNAASFFESKSPNFENRLDSLEKQQQVHVNQTRKLRGILGSLLCNMDGAGSKGSACTIEVRSSSEGDNQLEDDLTKAVDNLSAKKRALTAWQDASASTASAIFTRSNRKGSLGRNIASSPKVHAVTVELCGLDSSSLEKVLQGAPEFATGSR